MVEELGACTLPVLRHFFRQHSILGGCQNIAYPHPGQPVVTYLTLGDGLDKLR